MKAATLAILGVLTACDAVVDPTELVDVGVDAGREEAVATPDASTPPPPGPAYAVDDSVTRTLATVGGPGGAAFGDTCPAGTVLIGIDGRVGAAPCDLRLVCARVMSDGTLFEATIRRPVGAASCTSHPEFSLRCDAGTVAVGLHGQTVASDGAGGHVAALGLTCGKLLAWTSHGDATVRRKQVVGTVDLPGAEAFELVCPQPMAVREVSGRAGERLDAIGGRCVQIAREQPAPDPTVPQP